MSLSLSQMKFPELTSQNYYGWRTDMLSHLQIHDLIDAVTETPAFLALELPKQTRMTQKALAVMKLSITSALRAHVEEATTAKELWTILDTIFSEMTVGARNALRDELHALQQHTGEDALTFVGRALTIKGKLKECCNMNVTESDFIYHIVKGLHSGYEDFVKHIQFQMTDMTLAKFMSQLQSVTPTAEDSRAAARAYAVGYDAGKQDLDKHTVPKREFRGVCFSCGKRGHMKRDCPDKDTNKQEKPVVAYMVREMQPVQIPELHKALEVAQCAQTVMHTLQPSSAHDIDTLTERFRTYAKTYLKLGTDTAPKDIVSVDYQTQQTAISDATHMTMENLDMMLPVTRILQEPAPEKMKMTYNVHSIPVAETVAHGRTIMLDTGASVHIIKSLKGLNILHISWISNDQPSVEVMMAGGEKHAALARVTFVIELDSIIMELTDALYVPSATQDLLSVTHACRGWGKKRRFTFDEEGAYFIDQHKTEFRIGNRVHGDGLYGAVMRAPYSHLHALQVSGGNREDADLMHKRMGHPCAQVMQHMVKHNCAKGLPTKLACDDKVCSTCMRAKHARIKFDASDTKTHRPLELVHADVMGPFPVPSLGGSRFALVMMDDFSGLVHVTCLASKGDVTRTMKSVLTRWQNQLDMTVKCIRTDNGSEFVNTVMTAFCEALGIKHETSAPYTPEQNGKAERVNRTLMNIARALLFHAGAPAIMWAEALMTAVRLTNVTAAIRRDKTPFQLFWGVKPDLTMLRVWGCTAYVQVPEQKRRKLDDRSIVGTLVGYAVASKAYRILVKKGGSFHVTESREVIFDELSTGAFLDAATGHDTDVPLIMELFGSGTDTAEQDNHAVDGHPVDVVPLAGVAADAAAQPAAVAADAAAVIADVDDMPDLDHASEQSDHDLQDPNDIDEADDDQMHEPALPVAQEGRPQRNAAPPQRFGDYVVHHVTDKLTDEPLTLAEVKARPDWRQWEEAMLTEIASLHANNTYTLLDPLPGVKPIPTKWVYKLKRDELGRIEKYRARIVVKGYAQKAGVDYTDVYAPVSKYSTARFLMSQVALHDLELHQLDVKAAFMHSDLDETVYAAPPAGHPDAGRVWKLDKALYGLKQSGRAWFQHLKRILLKMGMTVSHADESLYIFKSTQDGVITYVLVYVDDLLLAGSRHVIRHITEQLQKQLQIEDKGPAKHFLGMEIIRDREAGTLWLGQRENAKQLLEQFGMAQAKGRKTPMDAKVTLEKFEGTADPQVLSTYQSLIGSLMYLANCTRPDLAQPVGVLARFMSNPSAEHLTYAKQVLRYLAGTVDLGIMFQRDAVESLHGYCDADYAGDLEKRKSTSGFVFIRAGGAVSWSSKLQSTVAQSTCEAEFISAAHAAKEALWLINLHGEFTGRVQQLKLSVDNQGALKLLHHPHAHQRTKHIDVMYRFVQDHVERGEIMCDYIETNKMVADCLTKAVPMQKFEENVRDMGLARRPGP